MERLGASGAGSRVVEDKDSDSRDAGSVGVGDDGTLSSDSTSSVVGETQGIASSFIDE